MEHFIKGIKVSMAAGGALLIATIFHLEYAPTSAIMTILSLQSTLLDTLESIKIRAIAFCVGVFSAIISYYLFDFSVAGYTCFLLIFTLLSSYFHLLDALAINCVIASHYLLSKSVSLSLILNEVGLLIIGSSMAFLVNLHLHKKHPPLSTFTTIIDTEIKKALNELTHSLDNMHVNLYFSPLKQVIQSAYKECEYIEKNSFKPLDAHFMDYLSMRKSQIDILEKIGNLKNQMTKAYTQTNKVKRLFIVIEQIFNEEAEIHYLLSECEQLMDMMKKEPLPQNREEFENRALLYTMLLEIESFLQLKEEYSRKIGRIA